VSFAAKEHSRAEKKLCDSLQDAAQKEQENVNNG
jgi:hypothetical protein